MEMSDVPRCSHELYERETACADGYCPLCLARQLAEATARVAEAEVHADDWKGHYGKQLARAQAAESALAEAQQRIARLEWQVKSLEGAHNTIVEQRKQTEARMAEVVAALNGMLLVYEELHAKYDLGDCQATVDAQAALAQAQEGA